MNLNNRKTCFTMKEFKNFFKKNLVVVLDIPKKMFKKINNTDLFIPILTHHIKRDAS